jgi:DNA-binding transcriptional regulator LsrR (DeoR family)
VDQPELRALMRRLLSVDAARLQALSKRDDHRVIAVAGGKDKRDAVRGALAGGFMNVLITDADLAALLVES